MIAPGELTLLLDLLEARGYRLRRVTGDGLEVADAAPRGVSEAPTDRPPPPPAVMQELADLAVHDREEAEQTMWAHVGGRPPFLRRPDQAPKASPWVDKETE